MLFESPKGGFGASPGVVDLILGPFFHVFDIIFRCFPTFSKESGWGVRVGGSTVFEITLLSTITFSASQPLTGTVRTCFATLINIYMYIKPPRFLGGGGYVCQHFAQGGRLPAFGLNSTKSWQASFCMQKYINKMTLASFWGPKDVGKRPFVETYLFGTFLDISFGLPGPLRTAFELKNWSGDVNKSARISQSPHPTYATRRLASNI